MDNDVKKFLQKHLKGITVGTLELLTGKVGNISADRLAAVLDVGGHLAAISLKAAVEYFLVSQEMVKLLDAEGLKLWSETGRRLASHSSEQAIEFFHTSAERIEAVEEPLRQQALTLLSRQAALSSSMAMETVQTLPELLKQLCRLGIAEDILAISVEISNYSVKHSRDFLKQAPAIVGYLYENDSRGRLLREVMALSKAFVKRSGNTAAEFFLALPELLKGRSLQHWPELMEYTYTFLERSGGIAIQYFRAASKLLELVDSSTFELWTQFGLMVTAQGNASGYQFLKMSPRIVGQLARYASLERNSAVVRTVLETVLQLGHSGLAIECFKTSPQALKIASPEQFREWALAGISLSSDLRRAQAYYALESQISRNALEQKDGAVTLEAVSYMLRLYIEGLTGRVVTLKPAVELAEEQKISDGHTIYLPGSITEFVDDLSNFKLYKALAAHAAGQLEFGTFLSDSPDLVAVDQEIARRYSDERTLSATSFITILSRFPDQKAARRVFTAIENGRIDRHLRHNYRGIRRELDFVKDRLLVTRPQVAEGSREVPYEVLFQCSIFGRTSLHRIFPFATEFEKIFDQYVTSQSTVADSLKATMLIYDLIEKIREGEEAGVESEQIDRKRREEHQREEIADGQDSAQSSLSEPFSYWIPSSEERKQVEYVLSSEAEMQEKPLEPGDRAFFYDEWDRELADYRVRWCRVVERTTTGSSTDFVENTKAKYAGVISSIRHQFQLLRPENLLKVTGEIDGEDFDLQAVIDYAVDRRSSGRVNERLYTRKLHKQRDVAVSFLLDMSSSTARTISRNQMPYSKPGQRIIEIEKEGLVLMAEALEAVGDSYSIQGFTSEGRRNVKFYVIKDFGESYSVDICRRIGSITYQNNTRLGAAIRHATARLQKQEARTRLLIVLSDGRPYDHDYGDSRYAKEDTKVALRQAKIANIIPFCVTIDKESQEQLIDLYGEVGFTIIADVMSLPERMPAIYRRLTT